MTILSSLEDELKKITDENEKILFKQKIITFLNNESAKWDNHEDDNVKNDNEFGNKDDDK